MDDFSKGYVAGYLAAIEEIRKRLGRGEDVLATLDSEESTARRVAEKYETPAADPGPAFPEWANDGELWSWQG